jgi:hypothetical protein
MMAINLPLTSKSSLPDGLVVKPQLVDSETIQTSTFGEVLKDEEKKLQKEQEISALSVATVLAAMQIQLPITESAPVLTSSVDGETVNSETQPVLQVESTKQTTAQPLLSFMPKVADANQGVTLVDKKVVEASADTSTPGVANVLRSFAGIGNPESTENTKVVSDAGSVVAKSNVPATVQVATPDDASSLSPASDFMSITSDQGRIVFQPQPRSAKDVIEISPSAATVIENVDVPTPITMAPDTESKVDKPGLSTDIQVPVQPHVDNQTDEVRTIKTVVETKPVETQTPVVSTVAASPVAQTTTNIVGEVKDWPQVNVSFEITPSQSEASATTSMALKGDQIISANKSDNVDEISSPDLPSSPKTISAIGQTDEKLSKLQPDNVSLEMAPVKVKLRQRQAWL